MKRIPIIIALLFEVEQINPLIYMNRIFFIGLATLLFIGCRKPQACPDWNPEGYNSVASTLCNFYDKECEYAMVEGWMYEEHETADRSFPIFYLADTLWVPGDKSVEHFLLVDAYGYPDWDPATFRGVKLFIIGSIGQVDYPEKHFTSTELFPIIIDTSKTKKP